MSKRSLKDSMAMSSSRKDVDDKTFEKIMYKEVKITKMVREELQRRASIA